MDLSRNDKVLRHINKAGPGVEIGASHAPCAPKSEGYRTHVIDHAGKDELIAKYAAHGCSVERVEEVDFIWRGESYAELTGNPNYYDWVIASHLIEHTPDLIGFINSCDEILNDNGVLSLAVPDARYCFDHFRPLSGLSKVVDAHLQSHKVHTAGSILEFSLNIVRKDSNIAWSETSEHHGSYEFINSNEDLTRMKKAANSGEYVDVHCWCFTPSSFRLLIHDLNSFGFIRLHEIDFFPTAGSEFFMTLSRSGNPPTLDRLEYLKKIKQELQVDIDLSIAAKTGLERLWRSQKRRIRKSLGYLSSLRRNKGMGDDK